MRLIDLRRAVAGMLSLLAFIPLSLIGQTVEPSRIDLTITNNQAVLQLPIEPSLEKLEVLRAPDLASPFAPSANPVRDFQWSDAIDGPIGFYQTRKITVSSNDLLTGIVLNRLAYGPTPDEINRVKTMGAAQYIDEQLEPEKIVEDFPLDHPASSEEWQLVTFTGVVLTAPELYIYSTGIGDCYLDDIRLVKGFVPAVGENFIKDGSFDDASAGESVISSNWQLGTNLVLSTRTTEATQSGPGALHMIYTSEGDQLDSKPKSISQSLSGLNIGDFVTLSYWLKPGTNKVTGLVVRLSGYGVFSSPDTLATKVFYGGAILDDLRAWYTLHAVRSKKQLLETQLQFWDNHFTTQVTKSRSFFIQHYGEFSYALENNALAAEFTELSRWKAALMKPETTFEDLLRISAESPAMIIYLDTVSSRADGNAVANENYARELLELFTFGVDNGYDQNDVTELSRVWTGWTLDIVDRTNQFNPLAPRTTVLNPGGTDTNKVSDLNGVWAFNYNASRHSLSNKVLFPNKTVPARFGPPYAGRNYELSITGKSGTNGVSEGYEVISHLANQPFTQEFISVKLCRLLVHDDFQTGYDFTDPKLSPEGILVRQCMDAWENSTPKGNIRNVLKVILNSEMFRSNGAAHNKVKTPFEFVASAIRSMDTDSSDGIVTSYTDGYTFKNALERMGAMRLFDREAPDGWPENGEGWISVGTVAERVRFVQALLLDSKDTTRKDAGPSFVNPVALLKKRLPAEKLNDADAVVDYLMNIIFPGEGRVTMANYHAIAVRFLNTTDNGLAASPFSSLSNTSTAYDTRVRGLIAMFMTTQHFQEQ